MFYRQEYVVLEKQCLSFYKLIKAIFDHTNVSSFHGAQHYVVLENKCFVFLRSRIKAMFDHLHYLSIREQMFRLFTARINEMFDNHVILY